MVLLYDDQGLPIWAEAGFVDTNIFPGQSAPFSLTLPKRAEIRVLSEVNVENVANHETGAENPQGKSRAKPNVSATLPAIEGYSAYHVHVSSMTYDAQF